MKTAKFRLSANVKQFVCLAKDASNDFHAITRSGRIGASFNIGYDFRVDQYTFQDVATQAIGSKIQNDKGVYFRAISVWESKDSPTITTAITKDIEIKYLWFKPTAERILARCEEGITVEELV